MALSDDRLRLFFVPVGRMEISRGAVVRANQPGADAPRLMSNTPPGLKKPQKSLLSEGFGALAFFSSGPKPMLLQKEAS